MMEQKYKYVCIHYNYDNHRGLDDAMLQADIHVTMVTSALLLWQIPFAAVLLVKLMNFC